MLAESGPPGGAPPAPVPPGFQAPILIENPPCPYSGEIPGGVQNGTTITVQGVTPMNQNRFSINLCVSSGVEPLSDTALHVNPRYDQKCLVLNSLIRDSWGSEVRSKNLPLRKGEPFEMIILADSNEFKIALNGQHFAVFGHRMPKESARFLIIKGGIQMNFIRICGSFVPPPPPAPTPGEYPVIYNPTIPTCMEIPGGIYPQRMFQISGFPKAFNPGRFTINFKSGDETAFHFDVRFSFGDSHNKVVRNAFMGGDWGPEEDTHAFFPFKPGVSFDILILIEPYCYMVAVNGQHFIAFNHRLLPLTRVTTLEISGDVQINMIKF